MKTIVVSAAVLFLLAFVMPISAEITTNEVVPLTMTAVVPCANEVVELTGYLHVAISSTINKNNFSGKVHFQPMGVSGVGTISGAKYQATGVTQESFSGHMTDGHYTDTFVNNFRIIGQGPGNNLLIHQNIHVTINADGTVIVAQDNFSSECK